MDDDHQEKQQHVDTVEEQKQVEEKIDRINSENLQEEEEEQQQEQKVEEQKHSSSENQNENLPQSQERIENHGDNEHGQEISQQEQETNSQDEQKVEGSQQEQEQKRSPSENQNELEAQEETENHGANEEDHNGDSSNQHTDQEKVEQPIEELEQELEEEATQQIDEQNEGNEQHQESDDHEDEQQEEDHEDEQHQENLENEQQQQQQEEMDHEYAASSESAENKDMMMEEVDVVGAATKVQSLYRGHDTRKDVEKKKNAAVKIQSVQRGHETRKDAGKKKKAAVKIQSVQRGHEARLSMKRQNVASTKIQSLHRGRMTRKEHRKEKAHQLGQLKNQYAQSQKQIVEEKEEEEKEETKVVQKEERKAVHEENALEPKQNSLKYFGVGVVDPRNLQKQRSKSSLLKEISTILGLDQSVTQDEDNLLALLKQLKKPEQEKQPEPEPVVEQKFEPEPTMGRYDMVVASNGSLLLEEGRSGNNLAHFVVGGKSFVFLRSLFQKYPNSLIYKRLFSNTSQRNNDKKVHFFDESNPAGFEYILECARNNNNNICQRISSDDGLWQMILETCESFGMKEYLFPHGLPHPVHNIHEIPKQQQQQHPIAEKRPNNSKVGEVCRDVEESLFRGANPLVFHVRTQESLRVHAIKGYGKLVMDVWKDGSCVVSQAVVFDNNHILTSSEDSWVPLPKGLRPYPGDNNTMYRFYFVENSEANKPFINVRFKIFTALTRKANSTSTSCAIEYSKDLLTWLDPPKPKLNPVRTTKKQQQSKKAKAKRDQEKQQQQQQQQQQQLPPPESRIPGFESRIPSRIPQPMQQPIYHQQQQNHPYPYHPPQQQTFGYPLHQQQQMYNPGYNSYSPSYQPYGNTSSMPNLHHHHHHQPPNTFQY